MEKFIFRLYENFWVAVAMVLAVLVICPPAHAGKGYAPVATRTNSGFDVRQAANDSAASQLSNGAGAVSVSSSVKLQLVQSTAEAVVTGAIGGAAAGGAVGAAIGAVGGLAIAAIPVIFDMLKKANVRVKPDGTFEKADPEVCTVAPCFAYTASVASVFYSGTSVGDLISKIHAGTLTDAVASWHYTGCVYLSPTQITCRDTATASGVVGSINYINYSKPSVAPSPAAYKPASVSEVVTSISINTPTQQEVQALVDINFPPAVTPVSTSGPATIPDTNTVKTGLDGSRTEETCKFYLEYFPSNIKAHPECTTTTTTPAKTETKTETTTGPDGLPVTKTVTTTTPEKTETTTTVKDKPPEIKTCGLPGSPACKMDEEGTPAPVPEASYSTKLDTLKADQTAHVEKVASPADKSLFSAWTALFITPPVAACVPFVYDRFNVSLNPCPVVEGVRAIMAFLWPLVAFISAKKRVMDVI